VFHHVGLEVKDLERSIRFYREAFGMEEECRFVLDGELIAFLRLGEIRLELAELQDWKDQGSCGVHLAFKANDVKEAVKRVVKWGATLAEEPRIMENGWENAFVLGPDGEWIELISDSD
jgi:lactoylglutathione lyase